MEHWHYQILRRKKDCKIMYPGGYEYGVYEYYPDIEGKNLHTLTPCITGESLKDVENQLHFMLADLKKYGVKDYE